jgi:hypothetical protein
MNDVYKATCFLHERNFVEVARLLRVVVSATIDVREEQFTIFLIIFDVVT